MIVLALGTNLGDREWNLERAKALLAESLRCDMVCSDILETDAVGFEGPAFLNQAVAFESGTGPEELLDICQRIECEMGRKPHSATYDEAGRRLYEDRIIDIDILLYNEEEINTERLTVPHPQIREREYARELLKSLEINKTKRYDTGRSF